MSTPPAKPLIKSTTQPLSGPQKALHKLGLRRDIDLALHLPLRYEDKIRIVLLADARDGEVVQIEGLDKPVLRFKSQKFCQLSLRAEQTFSWSCATGSQ